MAKRRNKSRGCSSIMMLLAALFAILTVCGFMVMVWTALLLEQDDAQNATCHLSLAGTGGISATAANETEPALTPIWAVIPGNGWTRHATP